jgi:hypothetical protein
MSPRAPRRRLGSARDTLAADETSVFRQPFPREEPNVGASAAAVIVIKEKHIVAAFRGAGATDPERAIVPASIGVEERLAFRKLRRRGVLREAAPGTLYLDEASWEALRAMRRRVALIALLAGLIVLALAWLAPR